MKKRLNILFYGNILLSVTQNLLHKFQMLLYNSESYTAAPRFSKLS